MKTRALWVALAATVIAVAVHGYLTVHHYALILGIATGKGICNVSALMDCDAVNTSAYSELWGIPIALWGAMANALLALILFWSILGGKQRLGRYALYFSTFIALVSVVMGVISYGKIGLVCLFCSTTYILSFISFGALLTSYRPRAFTNLGSDLAALFKGGAEGARAVLIFGLLITLGGPLVIDDMVMKSYGADLKWVVADSVSRWKSEAEHAFNESTALTDGAAVDKAKMTLVEFADFRCPHCKHAVPTLHSFVKSHPDVRMVFMNFPLDSGCNPAMERPGESCPLAKAVFCANKVGKGWEAHAWMYDHQGQFSSGDLSELIKDTQLDASQLKTCMDDPATHDAIMEQARAGKEAGVEGTPSIYANGRYLPAGFLIPVLQAAYDEIEK